jgi:hypothetical protein
MTAGSHSDSNTLTHAAIWALERLAQQRYGRDAPTLNWSVAQELRKPGWYPSPRMGEAVCRLPGLDRIFCVPGRRSSVPSPRVVRRWLSSR